MIYLADSNHNTLKREGYVTIPNFLDDAQCQSLDTLLEPHLFGERNSRRVSNENIIFSRCLSDSDPQLRSFSGNVNLLNLMKIWLQSEIKILRDESIVKLPKRPFRCPWHQDQAYFRRDELITATIALTASGTDQGGTTLIPGSHAFGEIPHIKSELGLCIEDENLLKGAIDVQLQPGTLLLIDPMVIHRGGQNISSEPVKSYVLMMSPENLNVSCKNEEKSKIYINATHANNSFVFHGNNPKM